MQERSGRGLSAGGRLAFAQGERAGSAARAVALHQCMRRLPEVHTGFEVSLTACLPVLAPARLPGRARR